MNNNINNCKCEQCGKNIHKYPSEIKENNFCNRECYWGWLGREIEPNKNNCTCPNCGKEFYRKPSYLKKLKNPPTCSTECQGNMRSKREYERMCEKVGGDLKDFLYQKYIIEKKNTREISVEVYGRVNKTPISFWLNKLDIPIRRGSEAIALQWVDNDERKKQATEILTEVRQRPEVIKKINEYRKSVEGREAISKANSGKNNGMWNPELTDEERQHRIKRARSVPGYSMFRSLVYERDNYTCQVCGDNSGGNLVVHHLNGYHWDKESRTEVDNGVTLCTDCHDEFHIIYGNRHNNLFQFSQYLESKQTIK